MTFDEWYATQRCENCRETAEAAWTAGRQQLWKPANRPPTQYHPTHWMLLPTQPYRPPGGQKPQPLRKPR